MRLNTPNLKSFLNYKLFSIYSNYYFNSLYYLLKTFIILEIKKKSETYLFGLYGNQYKLLKL